MTDVLSILNAARVPETLEPQSFGDWSIWRKKLPEEHRFEHGWPHYTLLMKRVKVDPSWENMHLLDDDETKMDVVMEDSPKELRKHLPIWVIAHGHILKTGLGLGCVVRGLLTKPEVTKISVIEIDEDIIRIVGKEFEDDPRVVIHHGDALTFDVDKIGRIDFAWHDIWVPENIGLQDCHARLLIKYNTGVTMQGAWSFPRMYKRLYGRKMSLIG